MNKFKFNEISINDSEYFTTVINHNPRKKNIDIKDLVKCINFLFDKDTNNISGINFPLTNNNKSL